MCRAKTRVYFSFLTRKRTLIGAKVLLCSFTKADIAGDRELFHKKTVENLLHSTIRKWYKTCLTIGIYRQPYRQRQAANLSSLMLASFSHSYVHHVARLCSYNQEDTFKKALFSYANNFKRERFDSNEYVLFNIKSSINSLPGVVGCSLTLLLKFLQMCKPTVERRTKKQKC